SCGTRFILAMLQLPLCSTLPSRTALLSLSLHDALPISRRSAERERREDVRGSRGEEDRGPGAIGRPVGAHAAGPHDDPRVHRGRDRKSTRLNSSHGSISYAVFCLKKKKLRCSLYLLAID